MLGILVAENPMLQSSSPFLCQHNDTWALAGPEKGDETQNPRSGSCTSAEGEKERRSRLAFLNIPHDIGSQDKPAAPQKNFAKRPAEYPWKLTRCLEVLIGHRGAGGGTPVWWTWVQVFLYQLHHHRTAFVQWERAIARHSPLRSCTMTRTLSCGYTMKQLPGQNRLDVDCSCPLSIPRVGQVRVTRAIRLCRPT